MKQTLLFRAALLGAAVVGGVGGCNNSNDAGVAVPVDTVGLYGQLCARCHGMDGKGDPELKKVMPVRDFTDPEFRARARTADLDTVIMSGRNQMPAFGGTVSLPKIQALAGQVRRIAASAGGPAGTAGR